MLGGSNARTLRSTSRLAWVLYENDGYDEAEKLTREVLEGQRRVLGLQNAETIASMNHMLEIEKQAPHVENEAKFTTMRSPGETLEKENRYKDAELIYRELSEIESRILCLQDRRTRSSISAVLWTLCLDHRIDEAARYVNDLDGADAAFSGNMGLGSAVFWTNQRWRRAETVGQMRRAGHSDAGFALR